MKTTWRHFLRNKIYSLTNLLGLTLACAVLIFIYIHVTDELGYDKWLPGYDRVVRLQPDVKTGDGQQLWATSEGFVVPQMLATLPQVEAATRVLRVDRELLVTKDDAQQGQDGLIAIDSGFFDVFPLEFISGTKESAQTSKGIVITESVAKRFFGRTDVAGTALKTDWDDLMVLAVVKDIPAASHFRFKVAIPLRWWWPDSEQSRNMNAFYSYLRLKPDVDVEKFNAEIIQPWYPKFGDVDPNTPSGIVLNATPIADIHLGSNREKEFAPNGNAQIVSAFVAAGILLLIIAVINYVNLSSAIAIRRAKEIAVRKTIGASKLRLFLRFIAESFLFTSIAIVISIVIAGLLFPYFNSLIGKHLTMDVLATPSFIAMLIGIWIAISLISGIYPATVLSAFDPIATLKSGGRPVTTTSSSGYFQHGLVVVQFTISAIMIVVSFVIADQVKFIESRDPGFKKSDVIVLQLPGEARSRAASIKSELERLGGVSSAAITSVVPGKRVVILVVRVPDIAGTQSTKDREDDGTREVRVIAADADFAKTLGLQIVDGRDFDGTPSDTTGFILNEAAVKEFNLKDPVGRPFEYTFQVQKKGKIIGVVRDFNFASAHSKIEPVVLHVFPNMFANLIVRIDHNTSKETIAQIESAWKKTTAAPFNWEFLDVTFDALHNTERTAADVLLTFMVISMVIAGLGLFGMVMLFTQQRLKEVGIRKVMGASEVSLMRSFFRKYLLIALAGNLVAVYPALLIVLRWLEQFAFRIDLNATPFLLSLLVSGGVCLISTGWVIYRAARTNPISILRYE